MLVLRTCKADLSSPSPEAHNFRWPESGPVEAPEWKPTDECGHGLHGLPWGEGHGSLLDWSSDARWLVVEVDEHPHEDQDRPRYFGGKCKFRRGMVVHCGSQDTATQYIIQRAPGRAVVGCTATVGDRGMATVGDRGTATAGDRGTATAGDWGTATAGVYGTATAGVYGTATAGDWGTATAGDYGMATAGDYGMATAGEYGTATAGYGGILQLAWWDTVAGRPRIALAYVGENDIEANVPYRLDENHTFVKASNE
jgi:hypothetical protein